MGAERQPLVIDNGEAYLKAGFAGESAPRCVVPMLTTRSYSARGSVDWFVGTHARRMRKELPLSCPISHGAVINGEELSMIWHYAFTKELRTDPREHPVLITEYLDSSKKNRERLADIVFEKFKISALYLAKQPPLALYASGLSSGVSLDIGMETAAVVPLQGTFMIPNATKIVNIGGNVVTNYFQQIVSSANPELSKFITHDAACYFKENSCYVSAGLTKEVLAITSNNPVSYQAPDGSILKIGNERVVAPEIIFQPKQFGLREMGVQQSVLAAIKACPEEIQGNASSYVVLSGGGTLLRGFPERLQAELSSAAQNHMKMRVLAPEQRKYSVWIGGSILASLSTFNQIWVSKSEYEERGANVIFQKCP